MNKSESIVELAKALCKAQNEMGGAAKSSSNPFFKSNYSALPEVIKAIKQPFADHGLSYVQFPIEDNGRVGVETILMHSSGEWMSNKFTVQLTKQDAQGAGSAITYCRRYGLQAVAGIPSEDDDGNAASPAPKRSNADVAKLQAHIEKCGFTSQQVCESYKVKSLNELTDHTAVANQVTEWAKG
ncbi:MAG: hypothetical protein BA864_10250 [Desulfuromonadales bacterium C00003093]|nr:MAG: hypothetical protein BA864_10250 [Desulfuromonadales bacterium C00003093]